VTEIAYAFGKFESSIEGANARSNPLTVRSAALRSNAFRGWNTISIGLRSGKYSGKSRSSAPRALIASSTPATLWKAGWPLLTKIKNR
jgi:hypothetical protein